MNTCRVSTLCRAAGTHEWTHTHTHPTGPTACKQPCEVTREVPEGPRRCHQISTGGSNATHSPRREAALGLLTQAEQHRRTGLPLVWVPSRIHMLPHPLFRDSRDGSRSHLPGATRIKFPAKDCVPGGPAKLQTVRRRRRGVAKRGRGKPW